MKYCERLGFVDLDSARQSQIEAKRSERARPLLNSKAAETRESPGDLRSAKQVNVVNRADRFGKVAASQNQKKLTAHSIKARGLIKRFYTPSRIEVLKGIDIDVERGESVAIVGKSGEGKSTLLHILGTLEKPCNGRVEICGEDTSFAPLAALRNAHIGFIFQSYNLLDDYTVLDNVLLPARIGRKPVHAGSAAHSRALELLEIVGLKDRAHFLAKLLSGGEKQRAAIARALCNDPDLILADEPTGNLDHFHSQEIHSLLINLSKNFHKTLIVVTHDKELSSLCSRTLLLKDGNLSH